MNLPEFYKKYRGQYVDFDNVYGPQCVDLIKAYFQDVLGLPPFKGNALDYFTEIPGFRLIKNSWFAYPKPGDVIVWDETPTNPYGHVAIVNWVRTFDFGVFEQNNPLGSFAHFNDYRYRNVLGWLRPIRMPERVPLQVVFLGDRFPEIGEFEKEVEKYSGGKITCNVRRESGWFNGRMTQDWAYDIVDQYNPKEKFIFIFYYGEDDSVFYRTYFNTERGVVITDCPNKELKQLAFEFSHQVQKFYNANRGSLPHVEVVDSMYPSNELIKAKYDSVQAFYQVI